MTDKEKGRATNRGTAKENNQFNGDDTSNDPLIGRCLKFIKTAIVRLAIWGVLPVRLAQFLIQHGGMRHD